MLYRFKSRATADLIMLEPQGRRLLQIVGKFSEDRRGILRPDEAASAIERLEAAMAEDDERRKLAEREARERGDEPPSDEAVSLRQRARPFIDMLRRSAAEGHDVVWGV